MKSKLAARISDDINDPGQGTVWTYDAPEEAAPRGAFCAALGGRDPTMITSTSSLGQRAVLARAAGRSLTPVTILAALAFVTAALALAASEPFASTTGVATELRAAAVAIDEHAATMTADAERLAQVARSAGGPDQAVWLARAQHMSSDAESLHAFARRLRASAAALGDEPARRVNASANTLATHAQLLTADAQATIAHGRAMMDDATYLATLATPGRTVTEADAAVVRVNAMRIVDAGERTLRIATRVNAGADQLQRAFGR